MKTELEMPIHTKEEKKKGRSEKKIIYKKLKEIRMDDLVLFDGCWAPVSRQAVVAMKINWKKEQNIYFGYCTASRLIRCACVRKD